MEEVNLINEALKFMALGMGIVFLFLAVMIFALKLQAKLIAKFFPEEVKTPDNSKHLQSNIVNNEDQVTAAITAAIIHHNNNTKG